MKKYRAIKTFYDIEREQYVNAGDILEDGTRDEERLEYLEKNGVIEAVETVEETKKEKKSDRTAKK